jgi:arylsulfatase A-like enzyme
MADQGITWLKKHRAFSPDKPFFMYWAPGGVHGPHHVTATWADKYRGQFNQGWDKLREEVFARQKTLGWIPANAHSHRAIRLCPPGRTFRKRNARSKLD